MKILFLTPYLSWPPDHGGRIRTFHLLAALAGSHEVVNVTGLSSRDHPEHVAALQEHGLRVVGTPLDPAFGKLGSRDRVQKAMALLRGRSSIVARFRSEALARLVLEEVAAAPDLCVLDHVWMGAYRAELGNLPYVFSAHNVENHLLAQNAARTSGRLSRLLARREAIGLARFETDVARHARTVVVVSEGDGERLRDLTPHDRVRVVPNGVDVKARPLLPAPSFEPLRLLYVGGYDYGPNAAAARTLVREVLPRVRRTEPKAEALLVGHDPAGALSELDAYDGVRRLGRVPEVMPWYRDCSALVVPLAVGGGSRLKIIEAWAVGRPVVSTAIGADGLAAVHEENLLLAETPSEIANAVLRLAREPGLRARLVAEGRRRAERDHDWEGLRDAFRRTVEERPETAGTRCS